MKVELSGAGSGCVRLGHRLCRRAVGEAWAHRAAPGLVIIHSQRRGSEFSLCRKMVWVIGHICEYLAGNFRVRN